MISSNWPRLASSSAAMLSADERRKSQIPSSACVETREKNPLSMLPVLHIRGKNPSFFKLLIMHHKFHRILNQFPLFRVEKEQNDLK